MRTIREMALCGKRKIASRVGTGRAASWPRIPVLPRADGSHPPGPHPASFPSSRPADQPGRRGSLSDGLRPEFFGLISLIRTLARTSVATPGHPPFGHPSGIPPDIPDCPGRHASGIMRSGAEASGQPARRTGRRIRLLAWTSGTGRRHPPSRRPAGGPSGGSGFMPGHPDPAEASDLPPSCPELRSRCFLI
jgi:hypothetical protein